MTLKKMCCTGLGPVAVQHAVAVPQAQGGDVVINPNPKATNGPKSLLCYGLWAQKPRNINL